MYSVFRYFQRIPHYGLSVYSVLRPFCVFRTTIFQCTPHCGTFSTTFLVNIYNTTTAAVRVFTLILFHHYFTIVPSDSLLPFTADTRCRSQPIPAAVHSRYLHSFTQLSAQIKAYVPRRALHHKQADLCTVPLTGRRSYTVFSEISVQPDRISSACTHFCLPDIRICPWTELICVQYR